MCDECNSQLSRQQCLRMKGPVKLRGFFLCVYRTNLLRNKPNPAERARLRRCLLIISTEFRRQNTDFCRQKFWCYIIAEIRSTKFSTGCQRQKFETNRRLNSKAGERGKSIKFATVYAKVAFKRRKNLQKLTENDKNAHFFAKICIF